MDQAHPSDRQAEIADGIRWHDADGREKWLTGDQLLGFVRRTVRESVASDRRRLRREMHAFASELGRRWGAERRRHAEEVAGLKAEIETLKKGAAPPGLRAVG
jgi:hypothetical protein